MNDIEKTKKVGLTVNLGTNDLDREVHQIFEETAKKLGWQRQQLVSYFMAKAINDTFDASTPQLVAPKVQSRTVIETSTGPIEVFVSNHGFRPILTKEYLEDAQTRPASQGCVLPPDEEGIDPIFSTCGIQDLLDIPKEWLSQSFSMAKMIYLASVKDSDPNVPVKRRLSVCKNTGCISIAHHAQL